MAVGIEAEHGRAVQAARRRIAVSATIVTAGIALSAVWDQTIGGWVTILAVALLLQALHRFGRTGPG